MEHAAVVGVIDRVADVEEPPEELAEFQRYMIEAMKAYFRRVRWDFWPDTRMVDGEAVEANGLAGIIVSNTTIGLRSVESGSWRISP